jgi:hypothetical protein
MKETQMPDQNGGAVLLDAVHNKIKKVQTTSLDLSFNELMDMYTLGELVVDPEYQRAFRWSEGKESRFIESLVLGMPIPPIFVIEQEEGRYELIDGLQRLSSYFHFRGKLALDATDRKIANGEFLRLTDCDIVGELNDRQHDDLPAAIQIRLKRHFIRVEVIGKDSDERLRYHMFKRLNTGGENLSEQEIRNCTVRLLTGGAAFMKFIAELNAIETFRICTDTLTDDSRQKRFDQELVLRFFAFKNNREAYKHDVSDFMTEYMESIANAVSSFDYERERQLFTKTFEVLAKTLEERAFGWVNKKGTIVRGFAVYHFEAFTLGIQSALERIDPTRESQMNRLREVFEQIKADPEFGKITTGGGRNSKGALDERVRFVESRIPQDL